MKLFIVAFISLFLLCSCIKQSGVYTVPGALPDTSASLDLDPPVRVIAVDGVELTCFRCAPIFVEAGTHVIEVAYDGSRMKSRAPVRLQVTLQPKLNYVVRGEYGKSDYGTGPSGLRIYIESPDEEPISTQLGE